MEYGARTIESLGHEVRRIYPRYVKAHLLGAKNDANDTAAICEAAQLPNIRFVPHNSPEQIDIHAFIAFIKAMSIAGVASNFKNGREFAAYIGLVPSQNSTAVKSKLLGVAKCGDNDIRTLLVHGVRAALRSRATGILAEGRHSQWLTELVARRSAKRACVVLVNKTARRPGAF